MLAQLCYNKPRGYFHTSHTTHTCWQQCPRHEGSNCGDAPANLGSNDALLDIYGAFRTKQLHKTLNDSIGIVPIF